MLRQDRRTDAGDEVAGRQRGQHEAQVSRTRAALPSNIRQEYNRDTVVRNVVVGLHRAQLSPADCQLWPTAEVPTGVLTLAPVALSFIPTRPIMQNAMTIWALSRDIVQRFAADP